MNDEETNDVRERLQEIARTIAVLLPPGTGFALLCFDFKPGGRMEYVANGKREDICKAMVEFIRKTEGGKWDTGIAATVTYSSKTHCPITPRNYTTGLRKLWCARKKPSTSRDHYDNDCPIPM